MPALPDLPTAAFLEVAYGQSQVISGLNLAAASNETVAVMGRNGVGKTSLLKTLIGILPARAGRISVDSIDVTSLPCHRRVENGLAYVPQGCMIFPAMTVRANIYAARISEFLAV